MDIGGLLGFGSSGGDSAPVADDPVQGILDRLRRQGGMGTRNLKANLDAMEAAGEVSAEEASLLRQHFKAKTD